MKIYLIEDDKLKAKRLSDYLRDKFPHCVISHLKSYQSGLKEIEKKTPGLLVLDMTIPTFDVAPKTREGRPRSMGGRDILRKMIRKKIYCPTVIVTQFESFGEGANALTFSQLGELCHREFPHLLKGVVHYHATSVAWVQELDTLLDNGKLA
jgi:DNA-binding NarL/FixJ family response regulator